jgi:hypothetical protein
MKTNFSRRDAITVAALGLGLVGCSTTTQTQAQAPAGQPKSGEDSAIKTREASCNCGQLRVTCKGPDPERISLCHCNLCQKQSGSVFAVQARFPREQVTIEGKSTAWKLPLAEAKLTEYRNCASLGGGGTFHFCPVCGSTVWYTADADAARIGVKIGAFTDPTFPAPKISGFEEYQHPWAMNVAALPMEHVK